MDQNKEWLISSKGYGLKLRIKSLALLIVPILNAIGDRYGITIVSDDFEFWLDALFIVIFGVMHAWGWIRAQYFRATR